jgi:hypothetical protein
MLFLVRGSNRGKKTMDEMSKVPTRTHGSASAKGHNQGETIYPVNDSRHLGPQRATATSDKNER